MLCACALFNLQSVPALKEKLSCVTLQVTWHQAGVVAGAATAANLFESFLGAVLQGQKGSEWLSNDVVNMIQICFAAALAMGVSLAAEV